LLALLPALVSACKHTETSNAIPPAIGSGAPALPEPPKLDVATPESSTVEERQLRATGTTLALKEAELGPKTTGVLTAVLVEEGTRVRKGQVLFRTDATNAILAVKQAEVALAQAKVNLTRAELDFNRMKPLVEQGAVSPSSWDTVRIAQDQARVGVQQAEASLASSRAFANDTTIVAPFAGIVASKLKDTGETVTMAPATTVIVLQDISKIEVRAKLPENALTRIKAGDSMLVRFASLNTEKTIPITRINPSIDPQNRTIEVVGIIANDELLLKAGMLVDVTFPTSTAASEPAVPSTAGVAVTNIQPPQGKTVAPSTTSASASR
jgi:gold/copper resistance efflux system membrane fusion protein